MRNFCLMGLLAFAWVCRVAHADLSYSQNSAYSKTVPSFTNGQSKISVKNDVTRVEINFLGDQLIMLTRPDGTLVQINPGAKIFTIGQGKEGLSTAQNPQGKPTTIVATVKKLGLEKVNGVDAQRWQIGLKMPFDLTSPPQPVQMTIELWSSSTRSPLSTKVQASAINDIPVNIRSMVAGNVRVTGDLKGLLKAYANVPLRLKTSINGVYMATTETSNIATKNLPAPLFNIPKGYRQVSFAQWNQQQSEAVSRKMRGLLDFSPRAARQ